MCEGRGGVGNHLGFESVRQEVVAGGNQLDSVEAVRKAELDYEGDALGSVEDRAGVKKFYREKDPVIVIYLRNALQIEGNSVADEVVSKVSVNAVHSNVFH